MTLDTAASLAGATVMGALVAVIVKKCIFRELPVFALYVGCGFLGATGAVLVQSYAPHLYLSEWITEMYLGSLCYFFALAELRGKLVRFNHAATSGWWMVILLFVSNSLLLKSLAIWMIPGHFPAEWRFAVYSLQAMAVLELAGVLALVEWGMIRRFHWPDRELRIVSGFGFSGVVTIATAILYSHPSVFSSPIFHWVDLLNSMSDVGVLVYWLWYFLMVDGGVAGSEDARAQLVAAGGRDEEQSEHQYAGVSRVKNAEPELQ